MAKATVPVGIESHAEPERVPNAMPCGGYPGGK
ncbi:hypothetical protein LAUMK4_05193 [Mycobacterium persicum]|uniref:Uncharacterized protein n=1 Tax=Mycobacterium persicum TaxID=1487726 RepID=A0AB38V1B4_9MYCO|nr:hypothetical protein LAUMK15_05591 [Mycobacterium persicum]VAZ86424.1 hypothetical protein LAUMK42_05271 [Mycobacterium persicum]VBA30653.1 hypothetical protein LAUMK4_05193 [Mycobacterium persicum]